jgi:hypothetical protein
MNATELIGKIQTIIEEHGDLEVIINADGFEENVYVDNVKPVYCDVDNAIELDIDEKEKQDTEEFHLKLITDEIKKYILISGK